MNGDSASASVLVTGGNGFVGSWVVEKLVERGFHVRALVRDSRQFKNIAHLSGKIDIVSGDLTEPMCARQAVSGCASVVHTAAIKKNAQYHAQHSAEILRNNALMTINVLEASRLAGVEHFLVTSSIVVHDWGDAHYGYAWSKRFDEILAGAYARQYGFRWTSLRLPNTFGPRDNFDPDTAQVVPSLIRRLSEGENPLCITANTDPKPFSYVEDVATVVADLVEQPAKQPVSELEPSYRVSIKDLAATLARIVGEKSGTSIVVEIEEAKPISHRYTPGCECFDNMERRACKPLHDLSETLQHTVSWYLSNRT